MRNLELLQDIVDASTPRNRRKSQTLALLQLCGDLEEDWKWLKARDILYILGGSPEGLYTLLRRWKNWGFIKSRTDSKGISEFCLAGAGSAWLRKLDRWYPLYPDSRGRFGLPLATIREYVAVKARLTIHWREPSQEPWFYKSCGWFVAPYSSAKDFEFHRAPAGKTYIHEAIDAAMPADSWVWHEVDNAYSAIVRIQQLGFEIEKSCIEAAINSGCDIDKP